MPKLLFSAFLLFIFGQVLSQEYHPFLNNSSWIVSGGSSCCAPPDVRIINEGTDEVIGGLTYKKFIDPFPLAYSSNDPCDTIYVREDIGAQKVYKITNGQDVVLYDFTMEMADTITQYGYTWNVTEIEQMPWFDGTRKKITLKTYSEYYHKNLTQRWIEGVGSNAHPFYPQRNMYSVLSSSGGYNIHTNCSFQDGDQMYGDPEYCSSLLSQLSTADNAYVRQFVTFSPNPFASELTISATLPLQNASFKLYNMQGQLVRELNNLSGLQMTISRENLTSGLYFGQLSEDGKLLKSDKILID